MKYFFLVLFLVSCQPEKSSITGSENPRGSENVAFYWADVALQATANDTESNNPRPTITSRYLGLIFTAVFDAWSCFDEKATPVYLKGVNRVPPAERTLRNKEIAISYAAYHTLKEYYPADSVYFDLKLAELGLSATADHGTSELAVRIGKEAAKQLIESRKHDGSNQYGEESADGFSYADYTNYQPVNSPEENVDLNKWQPKYFISDTGEKYAPACLTPFWQNVKPITLDSPDEFRAPPPPLLGSEQLEKEVKEVVELQAGLTTEQKALVEFMRDGPQSVQQAGHWLLFAQEVSKRDNHNLDEDVKMYFLNQITAMDAFIASWDSKMYYDFARPYALVHDYFKDKTIYGWAGKAAGWKSIPGNEWRPYSPETFLCPPFPSYVSGHSTISGACAEALRLYTGSDNFGITVSFIAGSLTEKEEYWKEIELDFPTFTETAEMAGISRVLGGYHIQADNLEGLILGRKVAAKAYSFYQDHISGSRNSKQNEIEMMN